MHKPYRRAAFNNIYNLLFCDCLDLLPPELIAQLSEARNAPTSDALWQLAQRYPESRTRAVVFNALRARRDPVPAKQLLGIIIEVPMEKGLDTLAAFQDGTIRYINQAEKLVIMDKVPAEVSQKADELLRFSERVIQQMGPWERRRLPPPIPGNVRISFLVSDGLYFAEGPRPELQRDPIAGRAFLIASQLLAQVVTAALAARPSPTGDADSG